MIHFTLYSRSYCHLCDDMLQALRGWESEYPFTVDVVDVEADRMLVAQYDELVPVLLGSKDGMAPVQLCHYFLDQEKLKRFLQNGVLL